MTAFAAPAFQPPLEGTDVLPEAFTRRWAELGGGPIQVGVCFCAAGAWWMELRVEGRRFALLMRSDLLKAAEDLYRSTHA